jgi:hypothetical protein
MPLGWKRARSAAIIKYRQNRKSIQFEFHNSSDDGPNQILIVVSLRLRISRLEIVHIMRYRRAQSADFGYGCAHPRGPTVSISTCIWAAPAASANELW